jgi:lysophospholipase L1-like esterase
VRGIVYLNRFTTIEECAYDDGRAEVCWAVRQADLGGEPMYRTSHYGSRTAILAALTATVLASAAAWNVPTASAADTTLRGHGWVASWAASPVVGTDVNGCPAGVGLTDQTVRNTVFISASGERVRVRLTNAFGTQPLRVGRASVAVQSSGAVPVVGTVRALTFRGHRQVTVPPGAELFSDPVPLRVAALSTLLVSAYVPGPTGPVTNHPFTTNSTFLAGGDQALATSATAYAFTPCWMLADGVDVSGNGRLTGSVVALGDSITDTSATTANTQGNANHRWTDFLARRLAAVHGPTRSVVNAGLGGNRLLADREGQPFYGVAGLTRLDRDVFAQSGVRSVILLEATNDIGYSASATEIIAGYQQVIDRTHARGLCVLGGTVTPFGGSFIETPERVQTWQTVNSWVRDSGAFDGVIDFAAATAAPANALALNPMYDSGDHLHPNDAGTLAMANAVDLSKLLTHRC